MEAAQGGGRQPEGTDAVSDLRQFILDLILLICGAGLIGSGANSWEIGLGAFFALFGLYPWPMRGGS